MNCEKLFLFVFLSFGLMFTSAQFTFGETFPPNYVDSKVFDVIVEIPKVLLSPLQQFKSGIPIDQIQCTDGLQLVIKASNENPVCVKPETANVLIERGWGITFLLEKDKNSKIPIELDKKYTVQSKGDVFEVRYSIIGSQLQEITIDPAALSIIVNLENSEKGHFTIEIPRQLLDAQAGPDGTGVDVDFFVLVNGSEVDFEESSDQFQRTLTIPFEEDASQIEIIGIINTS